MLKCFIKTCLVFSFTGAVYIPVSYAQPDTVAATTLVPAKYVELPLGAIRSKGWLQHQLQIMRDGTTGHLDEVYEKIKNDNGWLGGKGDGWEETPYWLDGAVPLAYLLNDEQLKSKVLQYINWTLTNQRPSGYFGPITKWERETGKKITPENCSEGEDWWPKMVMLKVLQQYFTASNDMRVISFMSAYFKYQQQAIHSCNIGKWTEWAASRGADNVLMIEWLYGITKENFLPGLAAEIQAQSFPWSDWFAGRDWVINAAAYQDEKKWMTRHGVNVAMGLKDPAVQYRRTGDEKYLQAIRTGFHDLMTLHGLPMGVFSADEDLHGNNPVQGTELCAVVEGMFSLEQTIAVTGDARYMDALERMTFNALPTQTTDDYNNKQYFQIANQVNIKRGVFNFSLPFSNEMNNVLGMRSGYTCCLANMHQGWTKFASHLWYGTPNGGVAALLYSPNQLKTKLGAAQTEVIINEETAYPFDDQVVFNINTKKSVEFDFALRIPAWCQEAIVSLNGKELRREKGAQVITIARTWQQGDKLELRLPMTVTISEWGRNSRAIERGPLVYALKLSENWKKGFDEREGGYYSVFPDGDWNYGIEEAVIKDPATKAEVNIVKQAGNDFVWNLAHAPVEISIGAKKIPDWKIVNDVAPLPVTARDGLYMGKVDSVSEKITLVPYGCTKVRIVAFPVVR
jgi:hypothetical protein